MRQSRPVAIFAVGKGTQKLCNPRSEINWQAQNRAELDHDGVHLPISITQADVKQGLGNPQVRRGTDRQKFRQTFNNSQDDRKKIVVQLSSQYARHSTRITHSLRSRPSRMPALLVAAPTASAPE